MSDIDKIINWIYFGKPAEMPPLVWPETEEFPF